MSRPGEAVTDISFRDAIRTLWRGEKVDLTVITYDQTRKKGGEIREYKDVRLNINLEKNTCPKITDSQDIPTSSISKILYRPHQFINLILANGELRKIYKVGIIKLNGKTVLI